jgi:hypothetical protein
MSIDMAAAGLTLAAGAAALSWRCAVAAGQPAASAACLHSEPASKSDMFVYAAVCCAGAGPWRQAREPSAGAV